MDIHAADGQSLQLGGNVEKCFLSVEMSGEQASRGTRYGESHLCHLCVALHLLQLTHQHPLLTGVWLLVWVLSAFTVGEKRALNSPRTYCSQHIHFVD